ncbi:MAG: hypothetical protein QM758_22430 [Armatimonas sp.]
MAKTPKAKTSVAMSALGAKLWEELAEYKGLNKMALLELLFREEARRCGFDIEKIKRQLEGEEGEPE